MAVNTTRSNELTLIPVVPKLQLGYAINLYMDILEHAINPIIIVLGMIGNVLSFLVMVNKRNRSSSTCIYMACLAISDIFGLIAIMGVISMTTVIKQQYDLKFMQDSCKWVALFMYFSGNCSSWLLLLMTADRTVAILRPLKAASYCTAGRARKSCIICFVVFFCYDLHKLFLYEPFSTQKIANCQYKLWLPSYVRSGFRIVHFCTSSLIPTIILVILNTGIIYGISKSGNIEKSVSSKSKHGEGTDKKSSDKSRLTKMTVMSSIAFISLTVPYSLYRLYFTFSKGTTAYENFMRSLILQTLLKTTLANYAINFYLYIVGGGKRFRDDVSNILSIKQ